MGNQIKNIKQDKTEMLEQSNKNKMPNQIPYSGHTFILPLKWDYVRKNNASDFKGNRYAISLNERLDMFKFEELLLENKDWIPATPAKEVVDCVNENRLKELNNWKKEECCILRNEYYYFYEHIRKILYNDSYKISYDDPVRVYYFLCKEAEYRIHYNAGKDFLLDFDCIYLHVYSTGVALLTIHTLNKKYSDFNDICIINDCGRRLFAPYLRYDKNENLCRASECADSISINFNNGKVIELLPPTGLTKPEKLEFISNILGPKFSNTINDSNNDQIIMTSFNDDRMFAMSFVVDDSLAKAVSKYYFSGEEITEEKIINGLQAQVVRGADIDKRWYAFLFADNDPDDPSCQDPLMREILLRNANYTRWLPKYQTLFGITRYTFCMCVNSKAPQSTIDNFAWHYFQLVLLALIQRTSVLRFYDEASGAVALKNKSNKNCLIQQVKEGYLRFVNEIWFTEVTAQEQGIEMYNRMLTAMNIEKDVDMLDNAINELHEYEDARVAKKTENNVSILTFVGIVLALLGVYTQLLTLVGTYGDSILEFIKTFRILGLDVSVTWLIALAGLGVVLVLIRKGILRKKNQKLN